MDKTNELRKSADKSIILLRALACLLIINSHCREIYPIPFLAVGGGHGNAIFFVISGFCLARINNNFTMWYGRRLKRILPVTAGILACCIVIEYTGGQLKGSFLEWVLWYLDKYWFVWAILLFYIGFYAVFNSGSIKRITVSLIAYLIGYILLYLFVVDKNIFSVELEGFSPFKVYFYLGVFLLGGYIRLLHEKLDFGKISLSRVSVCLGMIVLTAIV